MICLSNIYVRTAAMLAIESLPEPASAVFLLSSRIVIM